MDILKNGTVLFMVSILSFSTQVQPSKAIISSTAKESTIAYVMEMGCSKTVYYYKDNSGAKYRICSDGDGYRVTKPNGSRDSWGTQYSLSDVEDGYGLRGRRYNRKVLTSNCECN